MDNPDQITQMLKKLQDGDKSVTEPIFLLIYQQLKVMANRELRGERKDHTFNTTALVHEAYLKMVKNVDNKWQNRFHFLAIASNAMRQILIDYARSRLAEKRGGGNLMITYNDEIHGNISKVEELISLDKALIALSAIDERQSRIIHLHFFGGLNQDEIAEMMGVSASTIKREWRLARAWLSLRLKNERAN